MNHKYVRKFWKRATVLTLVLTLFTMIAQPAFAQTSAPDGYVTISFIDYAIRDQDELDEESVDFPKQLKEIVPATQVPFYEYDSIADVTLRLLEMKGMGCSYSGSPESAFYLSAIKNFKSGGKTIASFGEFDAGSCSGWMITLNNWFINMSAADFAVEDGDVVRWQYTCQLGADIGNDWSNGSAKITGLRIDAKYGTLSPKFSDSVSDYTLTVPTNTDSVKIEALQENYWATLTYRVGDTYYKLLRDIPVSQGTQIIIESEFAEYAGNPPTDTDRVMVTIETSTSTSPSIWVRIIQFVISVYHFLVSLFT